MGGSSTQICLLPNRSRTVSVVINIKSLKAYNKLTVHTSISFNKLTCINNKLINQAFKLNKLIIQSYLILPFNGPSQRCQRSYLQQVASNRIHV